MMRNTCAAILTAALFFIPSLSPAFGAAGAAASPYLKLPMGARATGMGEAFTGIADDDQAMFYNVAGLTQLGSAHLLLMHNESFGGVRYEYIAFGVPAEKVGLDLWGSVGFSYTLVAIEDIPRTKARADGSYDQAYADLGYYFTSGYSNISFSYAWQATKLYSIGASVKILNEKVDTVDGWGMAADLGLFSKLDDIVPGLQAGMVIQNVGTSPTDAPLPVNMRIGLGHVWDSAFSEPKSHDDKLSTGLDFIMPIVPVDGVPHLNIGTEYFRWFGSSHTFGAVRLGYRFPNDLGALAGLTSGLGIGYQGGGNDISLDYTFVPYGELGNAHRIALNAFFGSKPRVIKPRATGPLVIPSGLKAKPGDKSAFLSWAPSPVRVDGYNVYMSYNPTAGQWYRVKSHNHHEATVNKLYNGYNMYFAVSSIRKKADGSWEESAKSEPILVRPEAPGTTVGSALQIQPAAAKKAPSAKKAAAKPSKKTAPKAAPKPVAKATPSSGPPPLP